MFNFLDDVAGSVGNFFSVDDSYTPDTPMSSPDAIKTTGALSNLGYFGVNGESEFSLPNSVKAFQDANGLKVDGVINKGGPTEKAISGALEQQSLNRTNPMETVNDSTPTNVTVSKPISSNPDQKSFTASVSFGPKPKSIPKPKIDPLNAVVDPLVNAPKPNKSMKKAWDEYYKTQGQKAQKVIVPKGNTTQQAIMSMMQDPRYGDKHDIRLRDHVMKQFERAFPGQVQYDETGKMIQPTAVITPDQVEAYDPDGELSSIMQANDDGSYTFTPDFAEVDNVEFTYAVSDGKEKIPQKDSYQTLGISKSFRDHLHERESKGSGGYKAKTVDASGKSALGRYQMRNPALQDAGMVDADGNWTGKFGVKSGKDFLNNPEAQEKAFGAFMEKMESYVKKTGAFKSIGVEIKGLKANFKISKAGLMSAAHRQGQVNVAKYLEFQKANGWKSDFSKLSPRQQGEFKSIETALRTYEHIPYDD